MKKALLKLSVLATSAMSLVGYQAQAQDQLQVVATTTQVADLVKVIGGDHVQVTGLMGPGVDPHGYEPTPEDVQVLNDADVIAYNGLHLEAMFIDVFESMEEDGASTISLENAISADQTLDSDDDDMEHDPHIWFSVDLWKESAQYMADELSSLVPDAEADFQANASAYIEELDELDAYIKDRVAEVSEESRYLVTAHDAFNYFGNSYGFDVVGIQGLNTQTEAGTGDIAEMADFIVEKNIKAVFIESSVSDRNIQALIEAVADRGGELEIGGELYSDSLGSAEDGADSYLTMYRSNIDTIVDALK